MQVFLRRLACRFFSGACRSFSWEVGMHIFSLEGWHAGFFLRRLACRFFLRSLACRFFSQEVGMQVFSGGWHAVIFQEVGMQLFFRRLACNLQVFLIVPCIVSIQMFFTWWQESFFHSRVACKCFKEGWHANNSYGVGM